MLKKFGFNAFYILFSIFMVWTTAAGLLYSKGGILNNTIMAAFFLCAILAAGVLFYRARPVSDKAYRLIIPVLFILYWLMLTGFGCITMTPPISDLEVLVEAADHLLEHGDILGYSYYFSICRNTLGNGLFIALMFLPVHRMGINIFTDTAEMWGIAVNSLMIVLCVFLLWKLAKKVLKNRNMEIFFILLSMAYIPYYLWAHRYYSDTLSLLFLPLSVVLYDKSRNSAAAKKIFWSVLTGVSIWLGYFLRGSIIVMAVAIAIYAFFCDGKDFLKTGLVVIISFIVAMSGWDCYVHHNSWIDFSNDDRDLFPVTMWLMYGAHGEGNYSEEDVRWMETFPDYAARKEAAAEKLVEYYSQYDAKSYLEFLTLKYGKTWGNGRFDAENYLNNQRHGNFTHYFLIEGMPFTSLFAYIANGLHFALMLLNIAGTLLNMKKQQWNIPMLMQIAYLGNILFLSFWETKARYRLGATPVILFIAVFTVKTICDTIFVAAGEKRHEKETVTI